MIAQTQVPRTYSSEEYLDLEVASEIRHEYIDGEIVPMTGGTPNHNQILLNLAGALNFALRQHPYRVFAADQRLWIPQSKIYTYPDVMVVKGELAYQAGRRDTITNPTFVVEVLSQSTRNYDKGDKFGAYRTLSTFQEYLLVDQYGYHAECYAKAGEKKWVFQEYDGLEETIELASLPFAIALKEIYNKVEFEPAEATASDR
ncbi:MAG: Uma2 family endonuclease [Leptolyngbya sp. SIO1E4]|nr:Uma2 family endonuclease [Leptolyngbya sp. SIO1E4]